MTEKPDIINRIDNRIHDSHNMEIERLIDDCKEEIKRLRKSDAALNLLCEAIANIMNKRGNKT